MNHRPQSWINLLASIPEPDEDAMGANQIYTHGRRPLIPMRTIETACESLVGAGMVDVVQRGFMRLYRWNPDFLWEREYE